MSLTHLCSDLVHALEMITSLQFSLQQALRAEQTSSSYLWKSSIDCGIIVDNLHNCFTMEERIYSWKTKVQDIFKVLVSQKHFQGTSITDSRISSEILEQSNVINTSSSFRSSWSSNLHPSEHRLDWTLPPSLCASCWVPVTQCNNRILELDIHLWANCCWCLSRSVSVLPVCSRRQPSLTIFQTCI